MSVTISDLKLIARNGGGMILDAKKIQSSDLKLIVRNASETQAQITLKNPQVLSVSDIKLISSNAKGCVVFDFYD
ncbi:MAG: hypothetical protein PF638_12190 [Candidatus Delongbacteria bacterium]|jgi:hypothetical protein|nr:hypothetical protein [Candidatus Delongbacteria bacterium]